MINLKYCSNCGKGNEFSFSEGRNRYNCVYCKTIHYQNPKPTATLICPKGEEILLVKRAVDPSKGEWGLPGGFIELGETPFEGAERELKEETNLIGIPNKVLGTCSHHNTVFGDVLLIGILMKINKWDSMRPMDDAEDAKLYSLNKLPPIAFYCHKKIIELYIKSIKGDLTVWCY